MANNKKRHLLLLCVKKKWEIMNPQSEQEIADIKNQYTKDTIFYTKPIEEVAKEIASESFCFCYIENENL